MKAGRYLKLCLKWEVSVLKISEVDFVMDAKVKVCYWRQRCRGDMSDIMFQKSRIKVGDISQHTLQSRKINGQHGLLSKACLFVRFCLKHCSSFFPPSQWK